MVAFSIFIASNIYFKNVRLKILFCVIFKIVLKTTVRVVIMIEVVPITCYCHCNLPCLVLYAVAEAGDRSTGVILSLALNSLSITWLLLVFA